MALGFFDAMFPSAVADYGGPETRRLGDILVRGKQYMATQEGFEWHGAGDTYVEHYLYHLLGDPTMQMWANPPVRFDPSRFRGFVGSIREIDPNPEPGDPPFYIHFEFAGEPLAIGSLVTVFRGARGHRPRDRGADGAVNIVPEVPSAREDNLTLSLQQDGAFPAPEPVEKRQDDVAHVQPARPASQHRAIRTRSPASSRRPSPGRRCAWSTPLTVRRTRTGRSRTRSRPTRRACGETR